MVERLERGSDAEYCSAYPGEGHFMISHSAGKLIPWIERCQFCGWIDAALLDRYAEDAIKSSISERAQRIAVAADIEPFAFVQASDGLSMLEICSQALAAVSHHAATLAAKGDASDGKRETAILRALMGEIRREINEQRADALESMEATLDLMKPKEKQQ